MPPVTPPSSLSPSFISVPHSTDVPLNRSSDGVHFWRREQPADDGQRDRRGHQLHSEELLGDKRTGFVTIDESRDVVEAGSEADHVAETKELYNRILALPSLTPTPTSESDEYKKLEQETRTA